MTFCVVEFSHFGLYKVLAEKVCGLVRSTWGTSQGEDTLGARDKTLDTKLEESVTEHVGKERNITNLMRRLTLNAYLRQSQEP